MNTFQKELEVKKQEKNSIWKTLKSIMQTMEEPASQLMLDANKEQSLKILDIEKRLDRIEKVLTKCA